MGLFGGTFNPPHPGHCAVSEIARKMLQLDVVWWLVTPHNPLKNISDINDFPVRIHNCRKMVTHPGTVVSDLENQFSSSETLQTVLHTKTKFPHVDFVWIAGFDNALIFHRWLYWRRLLNEMSFCFVARPPARSLIQNIPLRLQGNIKHRVIEHGGRYDLSPQTVYYVYKTHMSDESSTRLRQQMKKEEDESLHAVP